MPGLHGRQPLIIGVEGLGLGLGLGCTSGVGPGSGLLPPVSKRLAILTLDTQPISGIHQTSCASVLC